MFKKTGKTETISTPKIVSKDKKNVKKSNKVDVLIKEDEKNVKVDLEDVRKDS